MKLVDVYIRFFRSFNFDFLRQDKEHVDRFPWDALPGNTESYYPFVKVSLETDITTVVGANEAGKSQLITAVRSLLGDVEISPRDFCRYSQFFGVTDQMPIPEFGGRFVDLDDAQGDALKALGGVAVDEFWLFRLRDGNFVYVRDEESVKAIPVSDAQIADLKLPRARLMNADVVLPSSVSLYDLRDGALTPDPRDRARWLQFLQATHEKKAEIDEDPNALLPLFKKPPTRSTDDRRRDALSLGIVRDLFETVSKIDPKVYDQLLGAVDTDDGYASALTTSITDAVDVALNFPHWWSQDKTFSLRIQKDGFHLVFTMVDKTGQSYTFDERSGGMKYFLSYFIQRQAYKALDPDGGSEILLMDEPDAFLSTQGQQDLLRVLTDYAYPESGDVGVQVLYVTHSPFLIDKNYPQRIRVLQKGLGDEGTRVVTKATTEQYEPLRSAFGSFHAQTAFIGTCNLLVEGPADLVLFSGLSAAIRARAGSDRALDLNDITMVPVFGASQYRYMLHLTRARGVDRPAVIVLLDSDQAGDRAGTDLEDLENGFGDSPIVDPGFIFAISELDASKLNVDVGAVHEPEDLVPASVARLALIHLICELLNGQDREDVLAQLPDPLAVPKDHRVFDTAKAALHAATKNRTRPLVLTKIDFASSVSSVAQNHAGEDLGDLYGNFETLFDQLNLLKQEAMDEHGRDLVADVVKRLVERFRRDHRQHSSKYAVEYLLKEVEEQLSGATPEEERVRTVIRKIRSEFDLQTGPLEDIADSDFEQLKLSLRELQRSPLES